MCSTVLTESSSSSSQDSNYSHGVLEHSSAFMQPLIAPEEHSSKFLMSGLKYISPSSSTLLDNNSSVNYYSTLSNIVKNNLSQVEKVSQLSHWWVYEREQDVGGLIAWLNIKYVIRFILSRYLFRHLCLFICLFIYLIFHFIVFVIVSLPHVHSTQLSYLVLSYLILSYLILSYLLISSFVMFRPF